MERTGEIIKFIEFDFDNGVFLEPESRREMLREKLFDVMKTYNPGVVVKAGLGRGDLVYDLAAQFESYIVVVDPSLKVIMEFTSRHGDDPVMKKIRFINGDFNSLPVDYYAADLLVCIDYLDILETGRVIDEFRRCLQFEGILFLGMIVLDDQDLEGVYDDLVRSMLPLHNDYYLQDDLKTVLDLNEFKFIKGGTEKFDENILEKIKYCSGLYGGAGDPAGILEREGDGFRKFYGLNEGRLSISYYTGLFRRKKYEPVRI
ncbi:MAG: class I SAM-dependent methyltransferase [Spirochaetes bacterium]|jgi:ubiquinone/menaquinone biosynthesis C-methylase UbiE|nr:class I SAM-dependent methyltransferase [Spirochaetota bacterium]